MIEVVTCFLLALGAWTVQFNEESQTLSLVNNRGNVLLEGVLSFETQDGEKWRVVPPRDGVKERLGIADAHDEIQGYIVFDAQGERLEATVYHRTRQFYRGVLTFEGKTTFRDDAFPCRTRPQVGERVLSLSTGATRSLSYDSLFSPKDDVALRFDAASLSVDKDAFRIAGRIDEPAEATWSVALDRDYFKKRWVPYYAPINRERLPRALSGWMSWNVYFDKATAEDNLAQARVAKEYLQPFGLDVWLIESWQGNSDSLPVSNFDNLSLKANENQFPKGMKALADDIRALGFTPGLWTAPFGTGSEEFYNAHKDWFLHNPDGTPMSTWNGRYTIDPSNDEAVAWLRHYHDVASHEWGYEFFKIDGMSGGNSGYSAHFFEKPNVRAAFKNPDCVAPFERCVRELRAGIGDDRVFLACQGHFTGPEALYADAARTGADIVHPNQPVKWENVLQQAGRTLNQNFVNNIVFISDPDTVLVGDLPLEEARVTATVVALPGQQTFFGDFLDKLPADRMKILQQTLPVCDVRPGALYPYFNNLPVWDLKVSRPFGDWDVVALFNWTDEDAQIPFTLAEIGAKEGEYVAYEFWTSTYLGAFAEKTSLQVPAHAVRLLALHPRLNRPQFLSSDRHLTQGAVDLLNLDWNEEETTLAATFKVIEKNATTARFLVPEGYKIVSVDVATDSDAKVLLDYKEPDADGVLAVKLSGTSQTCDATVTMKFEK